MVLYGLNKGGLKMLYIFIALAFVLGVDYGKNDGRYWFD